MKSNGKYHYSGNGSKQFWLRVKKIKSDAAHSSLYSLGCVLQNIEELVLNQLQNAEKAQRVEEKTSAPVKGESQ